MCVPRSGRRESLPSVLGRHCHVYIIGMREIYQNSPYSNDTHIRQTASAFSCRCQLFWFRRFVTFLQHCSSFFLVLCLLPLSSPGLLALLLLLRSSNTLYHEKGMKYRKRQPEEHRATQEYGSMHACRCRYTYAYTDAHMSLRPMLTGSFHQLRLFEFFTGTVVLIDTATSACTPSGEARTAKSKVQRFKLHARK